MKWRDAVALGIDEHAYCLPYHADQILSYNPRTGETAAVDVSQVAVGPGKWRGAVFVSDTIYGVPWNTDRLLVYVPDTKKVTGVEISGLANGTEKWAPGPALSDDRRIHA